MNLIGAFFIPCALICLLFCPIYLLPLLIVSSVFEGSSVWNMKLGSFEFGILPFYLVQICVTLRLMLLSVKGRILPPAKDVSRRIVVPLVLFWLWSCTSAFLMPRVFAGTLVMSPRSGMIQAPAPLEWTFSNFAQAAYLTFNVCMVLYALAVIQTPRDRDRLLRALRWAVAIVVAVGFLQFFVTTIGGKFPYELINNNPGYAEGFEEDIGNIHRYNSTFIEPSMAGSFLSAIAVGLFAAFLSGRREMRSLLTILAVLLMLFLTTSSTGFAALGIMSCILFVYFNPFRGRKQKKDKSFRRGWTYVLAVLGVVGLVVVLFPGFSDAVITMTVDKMESFSFWARLASDIYSFVIVADTRGIGAGLGSNRSSGLFATLLSTVGVLGTALLAIILYRIVKLFPGRSSRPSLQLTFWALLTLLVASSVAIPDINRPTLWVLLLLVVTQLKFESSHILPSPMKVQVRRPAPQRPLNVQPISPRP